MTTTWNGFEVAEKEVLAMSDRNKGNIELFINAYIREQTKVSELSSIQSDIRGQQDRIRALQSFNPFGDKKGLAEELLINVLRLNNLSLEQLFALPDWSGLKYWDKYEGLVSTSYFWFEFEDYVEVKLELKKLQKSPERDKRMKEAANKKDEVRAAGRSTADHNFAASHVRGEVKDSYASNKRSIRNNLGNNVVKKPKHK